MKFKIVELSHRDLQPFFYYPLSWFRISWDNENGKLIKEQNSKNGQNIADILVGGGEIKVSDMRAIVENDCHNTKNLRTSIETIPGYSLSRIKVPTYHITLQDIYNGINKEEAMPYAKAYFFLIE